MNTTTERTPGALRWQAARDVAAADAAVREIERRVLSADVDDDVTPEELAAAETLGRIARLRQRRTERKAAELEAALYEQARRDAYAVADEALRADLAAARKAYAAAVDAIEALYRAAETYGKTWRAQHRRLAGIGALDRRVFVDSAGQSHRGPVEFRTMLPRLLRAAAVRVWGRLGAQRYFADARIPDETVSHPIEQG